jgi:hypothetical protein
MNQKHPQRSIKIFVLGDNARSLKKITMFNWSGFAFWGQNNHLKQYKTRDESKGQGIYFLYKENEGVLDLYIGETESGEQRLTSNNITKDFWDKFIIFHSADNSLNKAHVKYLERFFVNMARNTFQINLKNSPKDITETKLSESDIADIEIFKDNIIYVLETLNISFFSGQYNIEKDQNDFVRYECTSTDLKAFMKMTNEAFFLERGSQIRAIPTDSFKNSCQSYYRKWEEIVNDSSFSEKVDNKYYRLIKDIELTSSSAAGAIVNARATQGPTAWRNVDTGKLLAEDLDLQAPEKN